jgi:EamA domain-containing membrane protein RarD
MGIVLFSTLVAALFFKERLSKVNIIGIILSVIAISFIAFG